MSILSDRLTRDNEVLRRSLESSLGGFRKKRQAPEEPGPDVTPITPGTRYGPDSRYYGAPYVEPTREPERDYGAMARSILGLIPAAGAKAVEQLPSLGAFGPNAQRDEEVARLLGKVPQIVGDIAGPPARNVPRSFRNILAMRQGLPPERYEGEMTPEEAQNPINALLLATPAGPPVAEALSMVRAGLKGAGTAARRTAPTLSELVVRQEGGVGKRVPKAKPPVKPSPKVEAPVQIKQPWEMTRTEAVGEYKEPYSVADIQVARKKATGARSRFQSRTGPMVPPPIRAEISGKIAAQEATAEEMAQVYQEYVAAYKQRAESHYLAVEQAVKQGKLDPNSALGKKVLADYPDLVAQAKPVVAPEVAPGRAQFDAMTKALGTPVTNASKLSQNDLEAAVAYAREQRVLIPREKRIAKALENELGKRTQAAPGPRPAAPPSEGRRTPRQVLAEQQQRAQRWQTLGAEAPTPRIPQSLDAERRALLEKEYREESGRLMELDSQAPNMSREEWESQLTFERPTMNMRWGTKWDKPLTQSEADLLNVLNNTTLQETEGAFAKFPKVQAGEPIKTEAQWEALDGWREWRRRQYDMLHGTPKPSPKVVAPAPAAPPAEAVAPRAGELTRQEFLQKVSRGEYVPAEEAGGILETVSDSTFSKWAELRDTVVRQKVRAKQALTLDEQQAASDLGLLSQPVPPRVAPQPEAVVPPPAAARAGAEGPPARPAPAEGVPPGAGGVVPPAGPVTPAATAPAPGSPLSRIQKMLETKPDKARDWGELALKTQEYINDSYYGLRRLQGQIAKRLPVQPGSREDIITAITRAPGAANAGLARYDLTVAQMKKLAPGANITDINTVLFAEHGKEILAAKGPARVLPGGVNTPEALDEALGQLRAKLGEEQYQKVYAAAQVVKDIYAAERQRLVQSGLISQELGDALAAQYPWYNPLRYLDYVEKEAGRGRTVKPLTVTSSGLRRLSEVGSEEAILDPMAALSQELIRNEVRIQKNELAKGIINLGLKDPQLAITKRKITIPVAQVEGEPVFRAQHGEIPGTLSFFENGKRQVYDVPEWMYREAVVLNETIANPVASIVGAMNGISRAAFTTVSPVFTVANMANDMLPALMRGGVLPSSTAKRLALSFKSLESDPLMQAYRLSGAYQGRFYGKDAAEIAKQAGASGGKVIGKNFDLKRAIFDAIPNLGEKGEQASRQAVFEKNLSKTLPGWKNMTPEAIAASPEGKKAAADAVEATINFSRGGYLVRSANPFVIFLNAAMEGTKLPFRTLGVLQPGQNSARARWTLAGLMGGGIGLSAYNMSYPEYFDVPDKVRWGSVMIMLPSQKADINGKPIPRYVTIIPNTREWAAFFAPLTYGLEKAYKDSPEEFGQFAWAMVPQVSPVSQIPLPPIIGEAAQQAANYDFYRGTPIVSQGKQNLPPTEQTGPYVSPAVESAAQATGLSPLRVQHSLDALFGGAGQAVTSTIDLAVGAKNKQGLALKARYDAVPQAQKQEWLAKLSAADKSALQAALGQAQQTVPVASSLAGRFYRERGGQQLQNEYNQLDKAVEETNRKFATETKVNTLGLQLGRVGASIDLKPGEKGGSVDLTPAQQANFQRIMAETVSPVIKSYLGRLDRNLPVEKQKELVQTNIGGLKDWARARFINENWPSPEAAAEVKAFERKWASGTLAEAQETLRPYWNIPDEVAELMREEEVGDVQPILDELKIRRSRERTGNNLARIRELEGSKLYRFWDRQVEHFRLQARFSDEATEDALVTWYGLTPVRERKKK